MPRKCDYCKRPLDAGRRPDARYCDNACKQADYRERHRPPRRSRPAGDVQRALWLERESVKRLIRWASENSTPGVGYDVAREMLMAADRLIEAAEGLRPGVTEGRGRVTVPKPRVTPSRADAAWWENALPGIRAAYGLLRDGERDGGFADAMGHYATRLTELADELRPVTDE